MVGGIHPLLASSWFHSDMGAEMSEQVVVRVTPDLLSQLRSVADSQERTVAQTVRLAIKTYLSDPRFA
jgi:hypothetical protein